MLDNHLNRKPIAMLVAVTIALGTIVTTALHAQDERSSAAPKSDKKPGQENAKNRSTGQNLESLLNDVNETVELGSYLLRQLTPKPGEGLTPLMHAARGNNIKELETLIKKGANVNDTSRFGWTALMFAAWKGHEKAVEALLDAGADPDVVSKRITGNTQAPTPKTTALAQAIKNEHVPIAQTLLARGADADPISVALAGGLEDLALLKKLHSKGADLSLNSGVMYYPSAMILACQHGRLKNVKWLMEHGVEPTPLALNSAVGHDHLELVQYLVAHEAQRDLFSKQDKTAAFLHAATKKNTKTVNYDRNLQIIQLLLAHGADRNHRPAGGQGKGKTTLEYLKEQRVKAVERIKLNRPGEQSWDKRWLPHRDAIIRILEAPPLPKQNERG